MIEIDGSFEEGGGQILRYALAFSTLTQKPVRVINIRKSRPKPGLKLQHIACIEAFKEWTKSKATDIYLGSKTIDFYPKPTKKRTFNININSAGSCTLVLQSLLLPSCFSKGRVKIRLTGGTDVAWAIPFDFLKNVVLPYYEPYVEEIKLNLNKRGYYPKGGGEIEFFCKPKTLFENGGLEKEVNPLEVIPRKHVRVVKGIVNASKDLEKIKIAERIALSAKITIRKLYPCKIDVEYHNSKSTGCAITLWTDKSKTKNDEPKYFIGTDMLGKKGITAKTMGSNTANKLLKMISENIAIDEHTADSIIPLIAVVGGIIKFNKMTKHMKSAIYVAQQFGFKIEQKGEFIQAIQARQV